MPNGGSDNCGECYWNRYNQSKAQQEPYCLLRGISIEDPFWTYCANYTIGSRVRQRGYKNIEIRGHIYSSGIFEGHYTRIPWYGSSAPQTYISGICIVTGVRFSKGIGVKDPETGEMLQFATNDIYCDWLEKKAPADSEPPRIRRKESTGDKELHGIYTELFHQGILCCDFMHCGSVKQAELDKFNITDRIQGTILCGAIGDAIGRQVEGMTPGSYTPAVGYTPWCGWKSGPIGTITDDTQMAWWLAESLLDNGRIAPEDIAKRFTSQKIRGTGQATRQFVANFKDKKMSWYLSGVPSSGNGAAMRAAPVGIFFRNDYDELKLAAGMQAMITHNDPMAIAGSIVVAYATALLLRMSVYSIDDIGTKALFCRDLAKSIEGIEEGRGYRTRNTEIPSTLYTRIKDDIPEYLHAEKTPAEVQSEFWSGAYVLESLPFALYCFLYSPGNFDRVLCNSVNESRDSDTVAAMACSFCGALNGLSENMNRQYWTKSRTDSDEHLLPRTAMNPDNLDYLEELEYRQELLYLADKMDKCCWEQ